MNTPGVSLGVNGMAATSQTLATQVAVDTLKRGGSAVDAAIAANAMLSLTEPHMCGPGGDLFAIVWDPQDNELVGLNASGQSPINLSLDTMLAETRGEGIVPERGPLAVTVPGAVGGWCALHDRYGRLPLSELFETTVRYANDGFAVGYRAAHWWSQAANEISQEYRLSDLADGFRQTYLVNERAPQGADRFRNPIFAETLERIGAGGRDAFYAGEMAEELIDCVQRCGGWLTLEDLQSNQPEWIDPISANYRGYDVIELPPNGCGMTVLQLLNILEHYPIVEFGFSSPDYWHALIEAKKLVFEDRARFYADPSYAEFPIEKLLEESYTRQRLAGIDPVTAASKFSYGEVSIKGTDTTYLTVADKDGMMVSLIQSIFQAFGTGIVPPNLGFALQGRGAGFTLEANHPNLYAPGKQPFHTIVPAFVMQDGQPWMSFGVMGADMQPQGQAQILVNMIDFGTDPQTACAMPRMRHFGGTQPSGLRIEGAGYVHYEPGFPSSLIDELKQRGHDIEPVTDWVASFMGGFQGIRYDRERNVYLGASEPRLDGCALGY